MRTLVFAKYQGLGNDFLLVETVDEHLLSPDDVRWLCDRRLGVGGDGVLLVLPPSTAGAAARMRVLNADGSVPEMCGNGVRCVARFLARRSGLSASIVVDTDAGPRRCALDDDGVTVDMGVVRAQGDVEIDVEGTRLLLHRADAGNPHAVTFHPADAALVARVGLRLATHEAFPAGANIEFARRVGDRLEVVVWERGVGLTRACGTGACAVVAVACAREMFAHDTPIEVHLPGGVLEIRHARDGLTSMRGPASLSFDGTALLR